jgi:hypothetical protein
VAPAAEPEADLEVEAPEPAAPLNDKKAALAAKKVRVLALTPRRGLHAAAFTSDAGSARQAALAERKAAAAVAKTAGAAGAKANAADEKVRTPHASARRLLGHSLA